MPELTIDPGDVKERLVSSSDAGSMGNQQGPSLPGSRHQRLSQICTKGSQVLMPPGQSSDPVDRPRLRAPAHLTSFNPKSKEIPVEGNSGAPVSFDVSQGDRLAATWLRQMRNLRRTSSAKLAQPAGTQWSGMHSAERLCGGGDDLIVWHVAQVLSDVPAMPERVLKLAMPVTPEHLRQRLTDRCARSHRLREHHLSVSDVESQYDGRTANRGWGEHP